MVQLFVIYIYGEKTIETPNCPRMLMQSKVSMHVETVCLLINQNAQAKHHVNVGIDAEDYYRIKEGK